MPLIHLQRFEKSFGKHEHMFIYCFPVSFFQKNGEEKTSLDSGRGSFPDQGSVCNEIMDDQIIPPPTLESKVRAATDELPKIVTDDSSGGIQKPGNYSLFAAVDDSSGESLDPRADNYAVCNCSVTEQKTILETSTFHGSSDNVATSDNIDTMENNSTHTLLSVGNDTDETSNLFTKMSSVERLTHNSSVVQPEDEQSVAPFDDVEPSLWVKRMSCEIDASDSVVQPSSQSSAEETSSAKVRANKRSNCLQDYVVESKVSNSSDVDANDIDNVMETSFIDSKKKDFSVKSSDKDRDISTNAMNKNEIVSVKM